MTDEQYQSMTDEQLAAMTPEGRQELVDYWRRKCLAGEADINMTKRIVAHLRANRLAAVSAVKEKKPRAAAGTAKPKSAKAQAKLIDSDALLAGLEGL